MNKAIAYEKVVSCTKTFRLRYIRQRLEGMFSIARTNLRFSHQVCVLGTKDASVQRHKVGHNRNHIYSNKFPQKALFNFSRRESLMSCNMRPFCTHYTTL